ncbi:MAG TPA: hypothetical protein VF791_13645 [Pyrinomonadaceae bacterium]
MRALLIITLLLMSASTSSAQSGAQTASGAAAAAPPDVLILKKSWRNYFRVRASEDSIFSASNQNLEGGAPTRQEKAATIRNAASLPQRERGPSPAKAPIEAPTAKSKSWHPSEQFVYQLKIKNTGAKKITALEWAYIFTDPVTGEELNSHTFQSFSRIKPDKSSTLTVTSAAPPTRLVTARGLEKDSRKPFGEQVIIRCVAYADLTVWENPTKGKGDCQSLFNRARKR